MTSVVRPSRSPCPGLTELWSRLAPSQGGPSWSHGERFPIAQLVNRLAGQVFARAGPVDMQHISETT